MSEAKLDDWRERLEPMLAGLQDSVVGPDEALDHSVESLRDLEHALLAETPAGQPPRGGLAEAAGGYLGEVLLTIGGAHRTDRPVRSGTSDAASADSWLTHWLTSREQGFPEWAAATGRVGDLDISPKPLLALEQVVRRRIPVREALREPVNDSFVQGAVWYVGEIARRHRDAHWRHHPDLTGTSRNPYVGRPYVEQADGGNGAIPLLELEAAVPSDETSLLLDRFEVFD
ncbi:hypothetical protein [Plantactinospora sp. B5E13]|uniref:hypothetical protein n=1 Tax=Plantactinospora sp. B5E13 TaxID=3153758 RepID=UPI00325DE441